MVKYIVIVASVLFLLAQLPSAFADEQGCECDFDTTSYSAECDCALACAVAVKDGKHCNIVCDGAPKNAAAGDTKAFGSREKYFYQMDSFRVEMLSKPSRFFSVYNETIGLVALPRLLRSSYIGAIFLSDQEKVKLDKLVSNIFSKDGKEIWQYFTVPGKGVLKKDKKQTDGSLSIEVSYLVMKLSTSTYTLKFIVVRQKV